MKIEYEGVKDVAQEVELKQATSGIYIITKVESNHFGFKDGKVVTVLRNVAGDRYLLAQESTAYQLHRPGYSVLLRKISENKVTLIFE